MIFYYSSLSQNNVIAQSKLKLIHSWIKAVGIQTRGQTWQLLSIQDVDGRMMPPRFLTRATGRNVSLRKRCKRNSTDRWGADAAPCLGHTGTLLVLTWNLELWREIWWKTMDLALSAKESTASLNELAWQCTSLGVNRASRVALWYLHIPKPPNSQGSHIIIFFSK